MTARVLAESRLPLPLLRRGKVREVYEVDADHLLLVASDRVSAFDIVMRGADSPEGRRADPDERVLVRAAGRLVPSHFVTAEPTRSSTGCPPCGRRRGHRGPLDAGPAHRAGALRVRGARLSLRLGLGGVPGVRHARRRAASRELVESARLEPPLFSPATKAESGHDDNVTAAAMAAAVGPELTSRLGTPASPYTAPAGITPRAAGSSSPTPSSSSAWTGPVPSC